ncbi:MAG: ribosome maturation factor RimM [Rhizobiaceae bacterium]
MVKDSKPGSASGTQPGTLVVARFGAPHGVKGEVRLKSHAEDPFSVSEFRTLRMADGRAVEIKSLRPQGHMLIATVAGVTSREQAEALNGIDLIINRAELPAPDDEDEYYLSDLVGLEVRENGEASGRIVAVHNFGAGDLLEIRPVSGATYMLAFTRANVPGVDISAGHVEISRPPEIIVRDGEP